MPTHFIIITGLPCTGKTTLGHWLANQTRWPFFSKDAFKEVLFAQLGWQDRAWSQRLSRASNAILLLAAESVLRSGGSVIVESNFDAVLDVPQLQKLGQPVDARLVQVYCTATPEAVVARFQHRVETAARHPGHVDADYLPALRQLAFSSANQALNLPGKLIEVDTTSGNVDYATVLQAILG
jgi:predicted kinase